MTKTKLRNKYIKKRASLSRDEIDQKTKEIKTLLTNTFQLARKNVSLFAGISKRNELNTKDLLDTKSIHVFAPVMAPKNELRHIQITESTNWKLNEWGIMEPELDDSEIMPDEFNIVIVPLLVADFQGYRVGYGGGYYDRFLAKCSPKCVFIGVGFFDLIEEIKPLNEFDIPLHYYISPQGIIKF